jgi:two-component system phosphate regulon response regulator OmpR
MTGSQHILVVDDDPRVRNLLCRYLETEGFRVTAAADGGAMREAIKQARFDLVLLDLILPGDDGLSLARELRQHSELPIIILTGKGDTIDRVVGLEMGADDYITKPFHLREVLARIRTVLRRARPALADAGDAAPNSGGETILFDGWELDVVRRALRSPEGQPVPITSSEFALLEAFARNANRVLSRDQLMDITRGHDWTPFDRSIDTQVARLRKKIEKDPGNPALIKTVRGAGYIFTATITRR